MNKFLVCIVFSTVLYGTESHAGYALMYSGGSLKDLQPGADVTLYVDSDQVRLQVKNQDITVVPAHALTELGYRAEVHKGIGHAFKSMETRVAPVLRRPKKYYITLAWDDGGKKGEVTLQTDQDEYGGILLALEGVSGKKAVEQPPGK